MSRSSFALFNPCHWCRAALAAPASSTPITLDFTSGSAECTKNSFLGLTIEQSHCSTGNQYLNPGDQFVLSAAPGTTFDVLSINTLYFWQELFAIPAADLPPGIDPLTDAGYHSLWTENAWSIVADPQPILHTRGYRDGALIAQWSPTLPDTDTYNSALGRRPTGSDFEHETSPARRYTASTGWEFGFYENFLLSGGSRAVLVEETWYTHFLGPLWAFDDLALDVHKPANTTPVPLPAGFGFLAAALAAVAGLAWRRPKPS